MLQYLSIEHFVLHLMEMCMIVYGVTFSQNAILYSQNGSSCPRLYSLNSQIYCLYLHLYSLYTYKFIVCICICIICIRIFMVRIPNLIVRIRIINISVFNIIATLCSQLNVDSCCTQSVSKFKTKFGGHRCQISPIVNI